MLNWRGPNRISPWRPDVLPPALTPRLSVADATHIALSSPLFQTEICQKGNRSFAAWATGPKHVADIFEICERYDAAEFLVLGRERTTYSAFAKAVHFAVARFQAAGLLPGERVALLMRNRLEWPVYFFASILAGGIAVPINGWLGNTQIDAMIEDVSARFLVSDTASTTLIAESLEHRWTVDGPDRVLPLPSVWDALPKGTLPAFSRSPDATAAIFFTSGTTGNPKGAMLSHRAMAGVVRNAEFQRLRLITRYPELSNATSDAHQQAALFPVPLFHVTGAIAGLIYFAAAGAKIVLMQKWDAENALELIERERITLLGGVPTLPLQILENPTVATRDISSLETVLFGGAPAPSHLPGEIATRLGAEGAIGWGMTETASTFLLNAGPDYLKRPQSCGLPVPVNAARIVDRHGAETQRGTPGELQVRGPSVTLGYWEQPDATDLAFDGDWFKTGDLAVIDDEGFVSILDRLKDVIIRGGENIPSVAVENAIGLHEAVAECAVVGLPHPTLGEEPVAVVRLIPGSRASEDALIVHARALLAKHMCPVACHIVSAPLPRNPGGKIVKALIRDMLVALEAGRASAILTSKTTPELLGKHDAR